VSFIRRAIIWLLSRVAPRSTQTNLPALSVHVTGASTTGGGNRTHTGVRRRQPTFRGNGIDAYKLLNENGESDQVIDSGPITKIDGMSSISLTAQELATLSPGPFAKSIGLQSSAPARQEGSAEPRQFRVVRTVSPKMG
jgi:hypothetical protein